MQLLFHCFDRCTRERLTLAFCQLPCWIARLTGRTGQHPFLSTGAWQPFSLWFLCLEERKGMSKQQKSASALISKDPKISNLWSTCVPQMTTDILAALALCRALTRVSEWQLWDTATCLVRNSPLQRRWGPLSESCPVHLLSQYFQ